MSNSRARTQTLQLVQGVSPRRGILSVTLISKKVIINAMHWNTPLPSRLSGMERIDDSCSNPLAMASPVKVDPRTSAPLRWLFRMVSAGILPVFAQCLDWCFVMHVRELAW